jgi:putative FmdB family regulatory protein
MPLYEYYCKSCKKIFEKLSKYGEDKTKCPKCEKECKKFISISNFKINGYSYANGYSKGAKTKHDKVD